MRNISIWNARRLHPEFNKVAFKKLQAQFTKPAQGIEREIKPDLLIH